MKRNLLFISRYPEIIDEFQGILEEKQIETDIAQNGTDAMELLKQKEYQILVTDLNLDGYNGDKIISYVNQVFPNTICMLYTNSISAVQLGFYLNKRDVFRVFLRPVNFRQEFMQALEEAYELYDLKKHDRDSRHPPDLLPEMLKLIESGEYDSVATRRVSREGEPPIRSWFARRFYSLINKISDADIVDGARDFRLMRREMVDAIVAMGETNRFSKGIFGWIGFRTYWLPYENRERVAGTTKWNFWGLCKYAIDGIINFSEAPLSIASWFGIIMTAIAFIFLLFIVVRRLVYGDPVAGWASTICIIVFIGGIQLFCMGVMGQYIAKNYSESKHRPHYIVSETNKPDAEKIK